MRKRKNLPVGDRSCIVHAATPSGIVLVRKRQRYSGEVRFWEFPGGKGNNRDRSPVITAVREFREETGARLNVADLHLVGSWTEYNHFTHRPFQMYLYVTRLSAKALEQLVAQSSEGEEVRHFTWIEVEKLIEEGQFSPYHYAKAVSFNVWRPR